MKRHASPVSSAIESLEDRVMLSPQLVSAADPSLPSDFTGSWHSHISNNSPSVSDNGRYVAFVSEADNLVPGDNNNTHDVFRYDRQTGEVELVSRNKHGTGTGNSLSDRPVISADGSVVAFHSLSSDMHPLDTDGSEFDPFGSNDGGDVFAYDFDTDTMTLVTVNKDRTDSSNESSWEPVLGANPLAISDDGSVVAFDSPASNLHALDSDTDNDVFAYNITTDTMTLISVNSDRTGSGNDGSSGPVISADGSVVAFQSSAGNLHSMADRYVGNVLAYDLDTDTMTLVSVNEDGTGDGNDFSGSPTISDDGSVVAFQSQADNLHALDADGDTSGRDVFAYNIATETMTLVSVKSDGTGSSSGNSRKPVISGDGSTVAFEGWGNDLHSLDDDSDSGYAYRDVFAYDLTTDSMTLVSVNEDRNGSADGYTDDPVISADGSVVAFSSIAGNLHPLGSNDAIEVYAYDLAADTMTLVSRNQDGTGGGNEPDSTPVISADGSVVAFESAASNLVEKDENGRQDIFVRKLSESQVEVATKHHPDLASASPKTGSWITTRSEGIKETGRSVSDDGRYVVFESGAGNIVPNDNNGVFDVFRYDRETGNVALVSQNSDGTGSGNGESIDPAISGDGSVVAFQSEATNLNALDSDGGSGGRDIYAYDFSTDTMTLVSVNADSDGSGNNDSLEPVISADGSTVAFQSDATNLHSLDTDTIGDIFAYDLTTDTMTLVSVNSDGTGSGNSFGSSMPVINADGSVVAFQSTSDNLHDLDSDSGSSGQDVYAYNLDTQTMTLVSVNEDGTGSGNEISESPSVSADGSVVAFESIATDLHALDSDSGFLARDVYAYDLETDTMTLVSVNKDDNGSGDHSSWMPEISGDGSVVAFQSYASNLHPLASDLSLEIFAYDLTTDTMNLVSVNSDGDGSGNGGSRNPVINHDGSVVAFKSTGDNLHPLDSDSGKDGGEDVYAYDLSTGTMTLVSLNQDGTASGNGASVFPRISADGSTVIFESKASDLAPKDYNHAQDVFLVEMGFDISATSGDDTIRFEVPADSTGQFAVTINGSTTNYDASKYALINLKGGTGTDELTIVGSSGDEQVKLWPNQAEFASFFDLNASQMHTIIVQSGGGNDTAFLHDSSADDTFRGRPTQSSLEGTGFENQVDNFSKVYALAGNGGSDTAFLFDSSGNDKFVAHPGAAWMVGSGYYNYTRDFSKAYGLADNGGNDTAFFYDSTGYDKFVAHSNGRWMVGSGFYNYGRGFSRAYGFAYKGGGDLGFFYDSTGNDKFISHPGASWVTGDGFYNYGRDFARVYAFANKGGYDSAYFYDSSGYDKFVTHPNLAWMQGNGFYNYANGFTVNRGYSIRGGADLAYIYDSSGDDTLTGRDDYAKQLGPGYRSEAYRFARVYAYSNKGGSDTLDVQDIDYIFSDFGNWQ